MLLRFPPAGVPPFVESGGGLDGGLRGGAAVVAARERGHEPLSL